MPWSGAPPAWAALPEEADELRHQTVVGAAERRRGRRSAFAVTWTIIAMSTSSNAPSRISSALPPRNSILPARLAPRRYSISTYSSAGTANSTTRPASSGARPISAARPAPSMLRDLGVVAAGVDRPRDRIGEPGCPGRRARRARRAPPPSGRPAGRQVGADAGQAPGPRAARDPGRGTPVRRSFAVFSSR